jgi:hypothetical protein
LGAKIAGLEKDIAALSRQDDDVTCLMTIPGVGIITASTFKAYVSDSAVFKSRRQFSSWIGLTPRANDNGAKSRPGRFSKRGNPTLRALLYLAGVTVVRRAKTKDGTNTWLEMLVERKPYRVAPVAAANKIAREIWALIAILIAPRGTEEPEFSQRKQSKRPERPLGGRRRKLGGSLFPIKTVWATSVALSYGQTPGAPDLLEFLRDLLD